MFELQFSSLREFLQMGEYAFNVWSVYALFALFFAINLYYPVLRKKQILREQKRRLVVQNAAQQTPGKTTEGGERNAGGTLGDSS